MGEFLLTLDLQTFAGETMQDLLQDRADVHDQMEEMLKTAKAENRDLTEEETVKFDELDAQFAEIDAKITAKQEQNQRVAKVAARASVINGQSAQPFRPAAVAGSPVQPQKLDDGGFKNLGEVIHAVRFGDTKGRVAHLNVDKNGQGGGYEVPAAFKNQLLVHRQNEWTMGTGEEGGFATPNQFRPEVLAIRSGMNIVRPLATVIPAGDPPDASITMPALDQGSNGVYGGVEVSWIAEGEEKPDTSGKLREVTLTPQEVAATTIVTDKLLRNWDAANVFISNLLQNAMAAAEDIAFLTGSGVGKPLGITNAPGVIKVNRSTASQIHYIDVVGMVAKMLPESVGGLVFVANQSALTQIATMQDPSGRYIFIQGDATKGIPSTLAGVPIKFTGKTPTLGTKGDLMLLDLTYYLIKDGSGPFIAASEHVLFKQNKTVIKVFWNVDGEPWVVEPLTLEDGSTQVSPYVILDVPSA